MEIQERNLKIPRLRMAHLSPRAAGVLKKLRYLAYVFAVLALLAWLALPPLLRWAVETKGSEALGRKMEVAAVTFNPFRLGVRLDGLRVAEADGSQDWISAGAVTVNFSLLSLWHRALVLDALRIDLPRIRVVRLDARHFNFSDLSARFASKPGVPSSEPLHFSINNIEVNGGAIEFDDQPKSRIHKVDAIRIGVPFISNLPTRTEIDVQPLLEASINGSPFQLKGEVRPFSVPREATLDLAFEAVDLSNYLSYLPDTLPVRIQKATATSGLHLIWMEGSVAHPASLSLSGKAALTDVRVRDSSDAPLLGIGALEVDIDTLEPLAKPLRADFKRILLKSPQLDIHRFSNGQVNVAKAFVASPATASKVVKSSAALASLGKEIVAPQPNVLVQHFELQDGTVRWADDAVPGGYSKTLKNLEVVLQRLDFASKVPAAFKLRATGAQGESLALDAAVGIQTLQLGGAISAQGLQLAALSPYYQAMIGRARLAGEASLTGQFAADFSKAASALKLDSMALDLKSFTLSDGNVKPPLLSLASFGLKGSNLDLAKQVFAMGTMRATGGKLLVERSKEKRINLFEVLQDVAEGKGKQAFVDAGEALRKAPEIAQQAGVTSVQEIAPKSGRPKSWTISLDDGELANWDARLIDRSGLAPIQLDFGAFGLKVRGWSSSPGTEAKIVLDSLVNGKGRMHADGKFASAPFKTDLNLKLDSVELIAAQPYVDDLFKILITRGQVSAQGQLSVDAAGSAAPDVRYRGSVSVDDFNALDRLNETDFMRWKHFGLAGLRFQTQPLTVVSKEIRLESFFTRLILNNKGRLNVRELSAAEEKKVAVAPGSPSKQGESSTTASPSRAAPVVDVGKILLRNGSVVYSDHFVKPNYEARLLSLNGEISGLSSDPEKMATLGIKASMDGAAPVNIDGRFNPFRRDQLLDIQAQVRDVDLTSASTYAGRYVGYGIERGKLSMDVQYEIHDRQLTARNRVKLDQLTFGDKVESPQATTLPVLLAVSLMTDRNGVIDLDLPISGSLDDPQFSIGSVVARVITNLVSKAVTAPFALLGSAFGGSAEELAFVDFAPGSSKLGDKALQKLSELAKALADRPALRLDVSGKADPGADVSGLKRLLMGNAIRALKAGKPVREHDSAAQLPISSGEYPVLLRQLYEDTKIDARQRNVIGMLKTVPVDEMERLLLGSYVITAEDLQSLARERSQTVRSWLLEQGKVSSGRVFLTESDATESRDGKSAQARVEFSLR